MIIFLISDFSDSEESDGEERRRIVDQLAKNMQEREDHRLARSIAKGVGFSDMLENGNSSSEEEEVETSNIGADPLPPGTFIVAPYGEDWYLGQVLEKHKEIGADKSDEYEYISYLDRVGINTFKWPAKRDLLNTLRSDIFFICDAPTPSHGTSSSRTTFSMEKRFIIKAAAMFSEVPLMYHFEKARFFLFSPPW